MCFPQFRGCRRGLGPAKNLLFASLQPLNSDSISVLSASCSTTAGTPMEKQHLIKYLSLAMPERSDAATQLPLGPTLHPGSLPGPQIGCRRLRRRWCRTSDCPTTRFSIPFTVTVTNPRRGPRMFHSKSHQRKLWHLQCSAGKTAEGRTLARAPRARPLRLFRNDRLPNFYFDSSCSLIFSMSSFCF